MKKVSELMDSRINATNVLVEMNIGEYEELVKDVVQKNEFQRRRVRSSKTIYTLLKEDLLKECVIPPIVLALTNSEIDLHQGNDSFWIMLTGNKDHLVILDGLQRTYTILELLNELRSKKDEANLKKLMDNMIRVEIYVGLNRLGILYRMLTLNTGQTPMSLRQQIEMLYLDYRSTSIDNIDLIRESEGRVANGISQYNFRDVIEGFNAYLDRDELPIDKADVVENIKSLEKLSKENQSTELFDEYLKSLNTYIIKVDRLCEQKEIGDEYIQLNGNPFGKNAVQIFKKPQAMSGFGAAIGKLIDYSIVSSIDEVITIIEDLIVDDIDDFLIEINNSLIWLKNNSKKIGNAQRTYFALFFRELFNKDVDGYLNLLNSSKTALRKYQAQNM